MTHSAWCRARSLLGGLAAVLAALVLTPPAHADSPTPKWVNHRLLTCDGTIVDTYLTPAGFGTPFHVIDSPDVIIPKHVEVIFPGQTDPVITLDVPGFDPQRSDVVQCSYTDPAGLFVSFSGIRS